MSVEEYTSIMHVFRVNETGSVSYGEGDQTVQLRPTSEWIKLKFFGPGRHDSSSANRSRPYDPVPSPMSSQKSAHCATDHEGPCEWAYKNDGYRRCRVARRIAEALRRTRKRQGYHIAPPWGQTDSSRYKNEREDAFTMQEIMKMRSEPAGPPPVISHSTRIASGE